MNRKLRTVLGFVVAVSLVWGGVRAAAQAPAAEAPAAASAEARDASLLVGVKSCKMCHKKDEEGNQFQKWSEGPHAKAFEVLGTDEAKAAGAKYGIENPQTSGKCLRCHSTAYNFTEEVQTQVVPVEEGVSCESCHGPGKNYKSKTVMADREQSIANGMIHPAKQSCTLCHNEESPSWDPERYTKADGTKAGFDVDQAWDKIKHPNPLRQTAE